MPALNSSAIAWIDYDYATQTMWITFHRTGTYTLRGVPAHHFTGMLNTSSPGWYFNTYLRGRY